MEHQNEQREKIVPVHIFLSYGHDEHAELAKKLRTDLEHRGHKVWFDKINIELGTDWAGQIEKGIDWASVDPQQHGCVILLMTPYSVRRPDGFCLNEINRARQRPLEIVPVMVVMVELPMEINGLQYLDMTDCVPLALYGACYELKLPLLVNRIEGRSPDLDGTQGRLFRALRPLEQPEMSGHLQRFTGREWLIDKVRAWIAGDNVSRVFWITGGPGSGKSAFAAWLCANKREIAALHVCRHGEHASADPRQVVRSIAWELTTQLPEYLGRLSMLPNLEMICEEAGADTLFDKLILQPIHDLPLPDRRILILIDGLDEATERRSNELALFLAEEIPKLPEWMRLLITSRPEIEVEQPLQALDPVVLATDSPENAKDVANFARAFLKDYAPGGQLGEEKVEQILAVSEKNWLYMEWLLKELHDKRLTLENIDKFPRGLGGVYTQLFARKFANIDDYEKGARQLLELAAAACEPLSLEYIREVLGRSGYDTDEVIETFGAILTTGDDVIRVFHKSLLDWVTDKNMSGHYHVYTTEGHRKLAEHGWQEYARGLDSLSEYMAKYLAVHLSESKLQDKFLTCITDAGYIDRASRSGSHYGLARFWKNFDLSTIRQACETSFQKLQASHDQGRACRAAVCLGQLFQHAGHFDDAIRYFSIALAASENGLDDAAAAVARLNKGWCLRHIDRYDDAIVEVDKAADLFAKNDNKAGLATVLSMKGMCLWHKQTVTPSLECLIRAVKLFEEVKDHRGRAEALNHIGIVYRSVGLYHKALENLQAAERIYRGLNDLKGCGKCSNSLGTAYWWSGQRDRALQYYAEANRLNEKVNQPYILGLTATNLGYVYLEKGDYPKSLEYFERGRQIRRDLKTEAYEMMDISGLARVRFQLGDVEQAKKLSRLAVDALKRYETAEDLSWAYYNHYVILSGGDEQERREAVSALAKAKEIVGRWLATIADPGMRAVAQDKVPIVREILAK